MQTATAPPAAGGPTLPPEIRASVDDAALSRVTHFFNGTLTDIVTELCQNARRAGASLIAIESRDGELRIRDDGRGIANPAMLLRFGGSEWDPGTADRESPAGMGIYSLAGVVSTITSRSANHDRAWGVTLMPRHYRGEIPAPILDAADNATARLGATGCEVVMVLDQIEPDKYDRREERLERRIEAAVRYLDIPVTFNGKPVTQEDFLTGTEKVETVDGLRIGIGRPGKLNRPNPTSRFRSHSSNTNVFGQQVTTPLPTVKTLNDSWSVLIDVVDCPDLKVVLPARKEIVENDFSRRLHRTCERLILKHLAETGEPVSFDMGARAAELGVTIPPPEMRLERWFPRTADDGGTQPPSPYKSNERTTPGTNGIIVEASAMHGDTGETGQMIAHAIGMDEDGDGTRSDAGITLFRNHPSLEGYPAYECLPKLTDVRALYTDADGAERDIRDHKVPEELAAKVKIHWSNPGTSPAVLPRVKRITVEATIAHTEDGRKIESTRRWDIPFAFMTDEPPDTTTILVTEDADKRITPEKLAEYLTDAYYSPNEETVDHDEKIDEYRSQMTDIAMAVLGDDDDRRKAMLAEKIAWPLREYAPKDKTTLIRVIYTVESRWPMAEIEFTNPPGPDENILEHADDLIREAGEQEIDPSAHAMHIAAGNVEAGTMSRDYAERLLGTVMAKVWSLHPDAGRG